MFLEDFIAEGAAVAHGQQAAWNLHYRKASPTWMAVNEKDTAFIQERSRWHLFARDVKPYRQAVRAEGFKAFSTAPSRALYEHDMCEHICYMEPDALRRHLPDPAPKGP